MSAGQSSAAKPGPVLLAGMTVAAPVGSRSCSRRHWAAPAPLDEALATAEGHGFPSADSATAAAVSGILAYLCAARLRSWFARAAVWAAAAMLTAAVGVTGWTIVARHRRQPGIPWPGDRGNPDPGPSLPGGTALETGARGPDLSDGRTGVTGPQPDHLVGYSDESCSGSDADDHITSEDG